MNTIKLSRLIIILIVVLPLGYFSHAQVRYSQTVIKFINFTVSTDKRKIAIDWSVETGVATNYFEIQKSLDGKNFKTIALVLGPDPKQPSGDCFGCFDKYIAKIAKYSYYRLKHIDLNGIEQLSETKVLTEI